VSVQTAAEVATRSGAVQNPALAKPSRQTRESDNNRDAAPRGEEGDDAAAQAFGNGIAGTAPAPSEKKSGRTKKRRRASEAEVSALRQGRQSKESQESGRLGLSSEALEKARQKAEAAQKAEKGFNRAQALLNQQALMQRASVNFEQGRRDPQHPTSAFGKQQAMLDSLIDMTDILYQQHTGDKAGEIYNRPAARQILSALRGLKDGAQPKTQVAEAPAPKPKKRKQEEAELARIEKVQRTVLDTFVLPDDYEPLDLVA
jgi:hypothetical protein